MTAQAAYPAALVDGERCVDTTEAVEVYQLTPGDVDGFTAWAGVPAYRLASGGVLLIAGGGAPIGLVELGDYLVRRAARLEHEPADGFWQRYTPAASDDDTEVSADG